MNVSERWASALEYALNAPTVQNEETPEQIGPFQIEKRLGSGGFGTVFLAHHQQDHEPVAIKWLHRNEARERESLFREAFLLSQIQHPNIVSSFQFGECRGRPYYAMQYVAGSSLSKLIDTLKRKQSGIGSYWNQFISCSGDAQDGEIFSTFFQRLALSMAQALSYLHQQGIVHRDLKPSNILIDLHGDSLLSDFGLAGCAWQQDRQGRVGTIPYMAPETLRGEEPTPAADIFSFGATLYELATLRKAFSGNNKEEICLQVLHSQPAKPSSLNSQIPLALDFVLQRCLEKEKDLRYASMQELIDDLHRCFSGHTFKPAPLRRARRRPLVWGAASLCAIFASSTLLLFSEEKNPTRSQANADFSSSAGPKANLETPVPSDPVAIKTPQIAQGSLNQTVIETIAPMHAVETLAAIETPVVVDPPTQARPPQKSKIELEIAPRLRLEMSFADRSDELLGFLVQHKLGTFLLLQPSALICFDSAPGKITAQILQGTEKRDQILYAFRISKASQLEALNAQDSFELERSNTSAFVRATWGRSASSISGFILSGQQNPWILFCLETEKQGPVYRPRIRPIFETKRSVIKTGQTINPFQLWTSNGREYHALYNLMNP